MSSSDSDKSMALLSRLLLQPPVGENSAPSIMAALESDVLNISRDEFDDMVELASSNHVIVRGLELFLGIAHEASDKARIEWAQTALAAEQSRIRTAITSLHEICNELVDNKYEVVVIKSLDHWPDLGSDLDLYTDANPEDISRFMRNRFDAKIASRSWGDRLACKWNFVIPGLPEAVEVHMGRLGQTGEQVAIASHLLPRSRVAHIGDHAFAVPSTSDRLMISTLQRMYRHFYFRLCDIVDSAALVESDVIDYEDLCSSASAAGIWEGVATYLMIVSDYVRQYRGSGLSLPHFVQSSARFGGDAIRYGRGYLRVPIMPQSVRLYGSQLAALLHKRELHSGARLSLLPWLATAAAVGQKITGSDKGIW